MLTVITPCLPLLYLVLSSLTPVNGQLQLARRIEQNHIDKRSAFQGGWALLSSTCDAGEVVCTGVVNAACCPSGTVCDGNSLGGAVACCPDQNLCNSQVISAPTCANSSWTLWQGSNSAGSEYPFCCLADQIGVNPEDVSFAVGACVANNVVLPSSKAASSLAQIGAQTGSAASAAQTSGGSTLSTISVSATTTHSAGTSTGTSGNPTGSSSTSQSGQSGNPTGSSSASKSGLSGGAIGGIVAGVVVAILLAAVVGFLCYRQGRRANQNRGVDPMHQDPSFGQDPRFNDQKVVPTELMGQGPKPELAQVHRVELGG